MLAHGAGGSLEDSLLVGVGKGLTKHGIATARFNFPYREAGRKTPGSQTEAENCYREVASYCRKEGLPLICGGKSYGGRMGSHIAAAGYEMDALAFLSYPLHPPGRPDRLRDEHLGSIDAPMLFIQGTRDPFAQPDLLDRTIAALDNARLVPIEGGDHSLRVRGRPPTEVHAEAVRAISALIDSL